MSAESEGVESQGNGLVRYDPGLRFSAGGQLVVPSETQFSAVLAEADSVEKLTGLRNLMSAHEEVAKKCNLAFEEAVRLVVFRLEVERKLGAELLQVVRRGGHGSKSTRLTSNRGGASNGLPEGITRQMAAKYRGLAAIPDPTFQSYLERAREARVMPSANGARAFATKGWLPGRKRVGAKQSKRVHDVALCHGVEDALRRFLGRVDVRVGEADVPSKVSINPRGAHSENQRGSVLFAECRDPGAWLPELVRLRMAAKIDEAIVVLPPETGAEWFRQLGDGWCCCFATGARASVVAYHGPRVRLFEVSMHAHGAVMHAEPVVSAVVAMREAGRRGILTRIELPDSSGIARGSSAGRGDRSGDIDHRSERPVCLPPLRACSGAPSCLGSHGCASCGEELRQSRS